MPLLSRDKESSERMSFDPNEDKNPMPSWGSRASRPAGPGVADAQEVSLGDVADSGNGLATPCGRSESSQRGELGEVEWAIMA